MKLDDIQNLEPIKQSKPNKQWIGFVVLLFLFELMVCVIYALLIGYNVDISSQYAQGDVIQVVCLTLLALAGFGLMNTYIANVSITGLANSLFIFIITIQHYFLIHAFWHKTGLHSQSSHTFTQTTFNQISFANINQDPYYLSFLDHASFSDAICCAICMILTFSPVHGRIGMLQTFLMTLVGAFAYQFNFHMFFRQKISDVGFGMRIFLFAGIMGLFSSVLLQKRKTTLDHFGYYGSYASRVYALIGFVFTFCFFPYLSAAGLFHTSLNNGYITYVAVLNMYLALGAGVLGCFAACTFSYRKIQTFDLIYTGLNGGIVFSSSADIYNNPTIPLTVGFVLGIVGTLFHSQTFRRFNKRGVFFTYPVLHRLIVPGVFSSILSAILTGFPPTYANNYTKNVPEYRSNNGQAGFQLIGILLTSGIALIAGVIVGLIYKFFNKNEASDQFNDNLIYKDNFKPEKEGGFNSQMHLHAQKQ